MAQYVEVPADQVSRDVRIAAEKAVDYAKEELGLSDLEIKWFDFAPPEAAKAWFGRPRPIFGTINGEELDHIRLWARQGPPKAGETAAHELFHIWSARDRRAKGMPIASDDDPEERAGAAAFGQRYLDEMDPA